MKIIFLDFDGVIRVPMDEAMSAGSIDFCAERMRWIAMLCHELEAKVVVSSDWRNFGNRAEIEEHLGERLATCLHDDWMTPISGARHEEMAKWLHNHAGEVKSYVILDDMPEHFQDAPDEIIERLVLTDARRGLTVSDIIRTEAILALKGRG